MVKEAGKLDERDLENKAVAMATRAERKTLATVDGWSQKRDEKSKKKI
jgi:hypothetical protein